MSDISKQNLTKSILFIGDDFSGAQHGAAHLIAHQLLLKHPEVDYTFWFAQECRYPVEKIFQESFRTIIGRSPQSIVAVVGFTDLVEGATTDHFARVMEQLIDEITRKCHNRALFCSPPPLAFASNPSLMIRAEEYDLALAELCQKKGGEHLRLSAPFTQQIKSFEHHQGTIYALHKGDGSLTPFGQMFLSQQLLKSALFL